MPVLIPAEGRSPRAAERWARRHGKFRLANEDQIEHYLQRTRASAKIICFSHSGEVFKSKYVIYSYIRNVHRGIYLHGISARDRIGSDVYILAFSLPRVSERKAKARKRAMLVE